MYCSACGRAYKNSCHCLYHKQISKIEVILIFIVTTMAPLIVFTELYRQHIFLFSSYLYHGSLIFGSILIILSILTFIFKRSYLALIFGCHQHIGKTLKIFGKPLNICSRCSGIFLGISLAIVLSAIDTPIWVLIILGIPLMIDGIMQRQTSYESNQLKRLITGFLFGPLMMIAYTGYHYLLVRLVFIVINYL